MKLLVFLSLCSGVTLTLYGFRRSLQVIKAATDNAQSNADHTSVVLMENMDGPSSIISTTTTITQVHQRLRQPESHGVATTMELSTDSQLTHPLRETHLTSIPHHEQQQDQQGLLHPQQQLAPVVDILSVGSVYRSDMQTAQRDTIGSHRSVRHFYNATEADDSEQNCHETLSTDDVLEVAKFCHRSYNAQRKHTLLPRLANYFFTRRQFGNKRNSVGWLCAQKRPLEGFLHMIQKYNYRQPQNLPGYLLVMDDDTWVNLDAALPFLSSQYPTHEAHVVAGCLMITDAKKYNFTVPYGGYGILFSRQALQNWLRPIYCNNDDGEPIENPWEHRDDFEKLACWRLSHDGIGELQLFQNGMSIADVMHAYAVHSKYQQVNKWRSMGSVGFCMHSDWAWAYFANYYHIAQLRRGEELHFKDPPYIYDRVTGYNNSKFYIFENHQAESDAQTMQQCANGIDARGNHWGVSDGDNFCPPTAHMCHRITPSHMRVLHDFNRGRAPQNYP
ncbi:hypothetical protein ACA910_002475 [Epithemia clementina (nom. ined.)]